MDSTVVALLAREALPNEQITLVNVCFGGAYSYSKAIEAVLLLSKELKLKLNFISSNNEQEIIMYHGPNCNQCTREVKIRKVKEFAHNGIIASGANMSDSWGKLASNLWMEFIPPFNKFK